MLKLSLGVGALALIASSSLVMISGETAQAAGSGRSTAVPYSGTSKHIGAVGMHRLR